MTGSGGAGRGAGEGAGPAEVAAILAALARLAEEEAQSGDVPPGPTSPGSWVLSTRPGRETPPHPLHPTPPQG
jgi:hypothetical protein